MHASQKVGVRDILDCDYKVIAQIVDMLLDPIGSKKRQLNKWALVAIAIWHFIHEFIHVLSSV